MIIYDGKYIDLEKKKVNNLTYFMILMNILATEVVLLEILSHRVFFFKAFMIKKNNIFI